MKRARNNNLDDQVEVLSSSIDHVIRGGGSHPSRVRRRGRRGGGAGASVIGTGVRRLTCAALAPGRDGGLSIDGVWLRVAHVRGGGARRGGVLAGGDHRGGREGIHVLKER